MLGTFTVSKEFMLANLILLIFTVIALMLLVGILKFLDWALKGLVPEFLNLVFRKLKQMLMLNSVLRYIIESFYKACFIVVLSFMSPSGLSVLEKVGVIIIALGLIGFTVFQAFMLFRNKEELSSKEMRTRYGALYQDFNLELNEFYNPYNDPELVELYWDRNMLR